jgi:hypothetical protein
LLLQGEIATISLDQGRIPHWFCAYFPNNKLDFSALFNPGLCGGWVVIGVGVFFLRRINP